MASSSTCMVKLRYAGTKSSIKEIPLNRMNGNEAKKYLAREFNQTHGPDVLSQSKSSFTLVSSRLINLVLFFIQKMALVGWLVNMHFKKTCFTFGTPRKTCGKINP